MRKCAKPIVLPGGYIEGALNPLSRRPDPLKNALNIPCLPRNRAAGGNGTLRAEKRGPRKRKSVLNPPSRRFRDFVEGISRLARPVGPLGAFRSENRSPFKQKNALNAPGLPRNRSAGRNGAFRAENCLPRKRENVLNS